jgi:hypothetical protein
MSEQIKKSDFFAEDPFAEVKATMEQSLTVLTKYDEKLRNTAKSFLDIANSTKTATTDLSKLIEVEKQSNVITNEKKRNQKEISTIEKEREKIRLQEIRLAQQRERNIDNYNKKLEREAKIKARQEVVEQKRLAKIDKENTLSAQLSRQINDLSKKYIEVALAKGRDSREAKKLLAQLTPLRLRQEELRRDTGRFQDAVGRYPQLFSAAGGAFLKFTSALGLASGLMAVVNIFRNGINTFTEFEQANVRVASVLGVTIKETEKLQKNALRLGATTAKSATEVVLLQEAYARLGFSMSDIIKLTKPTINGSIALNASLDETAELTGAIVNSFTDFKTVDAGKILDQLTLSTQKSALNFKFLQSALPIVSGAANSAKVPFSELVSLLGTLADRGIDASTAATSLRNIFIDSAAKGVDYKDTIELLSKSTNSLTDANDEFGKRGAVVADILSKNIERVNGLKTALDDAGGTADRVANENLKTLKGELTLLSSAWEGFVLDIESGNGKIATSFKFLVKSAREFFEQINKDARAKELGFARDLFMDYSDLQNKVIETDNSLKTFTDSFSAAAKTTAQYDRAIEKMTNRLFKLDLKTEAGKALLVIYKDTIKRLEEGKLDLISANNKLIISEESVADTIEENTKKIENYEKQLRDVRVNAMMDEINRRKTALTNEYNDRIAAIDKNGKFANDLEIALKEELNKKLFELEAQRTDFIKKEEDKRTVQNVPEVTTRELDVVKDIEDQRVQIIVNSQNQIAEIYERTARRKIKALQEEQKAADDQLNSLKAAAKEGAILDSESIKDAEKRKRDAIKEQKRVEKQQQRVQFIQLALQNITNQLKNGKSTGEALGSTFALQSALKTLFAGFEGFYKGTDNAPQGFAWVDEKGAEIHTDKHGNIKDFGSDGGARLKFLEQGDKIIPHEKSMELLNATLPTVKEKSSVKIDPTLDLLREQNRLLKNVTESKMTAEQIGSILHLTTEDKTGNLSRINRYKYKR